MIKRKKGKFRLQLIRAYDVSEKDTGYRVLVDRLWPRGVKKESLQLDKWMKELAPSSSLRKWFNHDVGKWEKFQDRYRDELSGQSERIEELLDDADASPILLIYAAKDEEHNHAVVLRDFVEERYL